MKTKLDPRHLQRIKLIKKLFAWDFQRKENKNSEIGQIAAKIKEIDKTIEKAAPQWPIDKIARIDIAILRLAVYELVYVKKEPPKVIIDEAVEIAKQYGARQSSSFINGVLGTIYENRQR